MASIASKRVNDLKESLLQYQDSKDSNDTEHILDILSHLDKCSMDVSILAGTLVGAAVSKFKTNADANVAVKAKMLVKKWKKLAKQSGVGNGSSSSASSSSKIASQTNAKKITQTQKASSSSQTPQSNPQTALSNPTTAFNHLENPRKNCAIKLNEKFLTSKASLLKSSSSYDELTLQQMMITRSTQVEEAIQTFSKGRRKVYNEKIRSLIFNLQKNEPLRNNIILGNVSPEKLVQMSAKELQTIEKAKQQEDQVKSLQGSRRLDWEQANSDKINDMCGIKGDLLNASLFTCGRCKSHKTTSTQKQTRSADEPMTVFVFCENCGNRWKC